MRNRILFATVIGILWTGSSSAQISPGIQNRRSPHIDSLRRVLKLSPHLHLDWRTSTNGVDTFQVMDDFNRKFVGPDWGRNPDFWQIVDGELWITPAAIYSFRYLAAFLPVYNTPDRRIYSVAYRWGRKADESGIREGSHALMLDRPDEKGSGYWLWHRTNWFEVWLWIVKNGTWEYTPGEHKEIDTAPSQLSGNPVAGDVITAYIRQEPEAHYFDYYVNDKLDATLEDATKEYPKNDIWHVGIFLFGFDYDTNQHLNNQVDDFTVTWLEGDIVAPAQVANLRAIESTATSVNLEWTSTGDNGFDGDATGLELRYSTSPITAANFASATLVPKPPAPAPSGVKQTFNVTNLNSYTTYYFALKIFDEAGNVSPFSNVASMKTQSDGVARTFALVKGCSQAGEVNKNLPNPLTAKVTDVNGVGVSHSPVRFIILSGNGAAGSKQDTTVNTDANGEAKMIWKLGTTAGTQKIKILAAGLAGSPDTCTATAKAAAPARLSTVSGNGQIVSAGKNAPAPLIVRLTDPYGNPHSSRTVMFHISAGGGSFLNGQGAAGKFYKTSTDSSGQALAKVTASHIYGDTTKITAKWTNSANTSTLTTSFIVLAARPDFLAAIAGNNQTAARGKILPDSLVVQILDAAGAPVKNHAVTFRVLSGDGKVGNNQTQVMVNTNSGGYAATPWTLGMAVGTQQVEAKAVFNSKNLRNAPFIFKATALIPTAVEEENAASPQQFALHQNFPNPFNPETTINFDLPEAGAVVMKVIDMTGRHVRQLVAGEMPAGSHRLIWNGQDNYGRLAESGVYFLVLRAKVSNTSKEFVATRKVVLMK